MNKVGFVIFEENEDSMPVFNDFLGIGWKVASIDLEVIKFWCCQTQGGHWDFQESVRLSQDIATTKEHSIVFAYTVNALLTFYTSIKIYLFWNSNILVNDGTFHKQKENYKISHGVTYICL